MEPGETGLMRVSNGTRTRDILDHNQVLYQLSYTHHRRKRACSDQSLAGDAGRVEIVLRRDVVRGRVDQVADHRALVP